MDGAAGRTRAACPSKNFASGDLVLTELEFEEAREDDLTDKRVETLQHIVRPSRLAQKVHFLVGATT